MQTQQSPPISVFIITKNEEKHLAEVLESVKSFNEIIVVDSGSTDKTVDIAKASGAKVVFQKWLGFAKQKSFAMSLCKNDWVLNLDGDEILPPELVNNIKTAVSKNQADAFRLYFEDIFWGGSMSPHSKKRSIVRLFKKQVVKYPVNRHVHENVVLLDDNQEKSIDGLVIHYGYSTTEQLMTKQNTYSSLKAKEKFEAGKKPSFIKLVLVFPITFVKTFFFRKMFLSGKRGFVNAMIDAMYAFLKEAKLFEFWCNNK